MKRSKPGVRMEAQYIKVLLIEDNPGDARLIREMLAQARGVIFDLEGADRLSAGLKRIGGGGIDIVLLDLSLPDNHGFDTFMEVQAKAPDVPIIVMSGQDDEELAVKAVQEGAQDYLVKGQVDSNLLVRSIRYAIERQRAEGLMKAALKEKDVLLKEIHHRVKNNLQIISSLLKLQSKNIKDELVLEIFKESQNRVRSMALIHEKLYQSKDLANINFKGYVWDLVADLFRSYGANAGKIALQMDVEDIPLGVEVAIPCGLIINELVSNALKYAFPEGKEGQISITFRSLDEGKINLTIGDNGVGIPEDLDIKTTETLGLHLVNILAEDQLQGQIKLDRTKGTEFQIEFAGVK